jgi:hypothetical protein
MDEFSSDQFPSYLDLTEDLWEVVISFLPVRDTCGLALVSKFFHHICTSDDVWRTRAMLDYGVELEQDSCCLQYQGLGNITFEPDPLGQLGLTPTTRGQLIQNQAEDQDRSVVGRRNTAALVYFEVELVSMAAGNTILGSSLACSANHRRWS